ncbi:hypothetical protein LTR78_007801 [Recurvomyces mirabilis]|uniref:Ankyrin repeat-containing protein n=1 Tax=Recurvomyces mirabilis TaxID=574656 RepID=A0AAE0TR23_9PEZI|nr:hypothetical protein LTR78_007801 [Recurvomyces mirabilis]KAK5160157.1 hypothetical protein LTS14_002264 [Recurvomyces mirabilis]
MAQQSTIDTLLNLVPDHPDRVLSHLSTRPGDLASQKDAHGYSLVHAAASYNHPDLLRTLMQTYNVDINILDEDGETALFNAETVDIVKLLIELGIDVNLRNSEGQTAEEKLDHEDEQPEIAAFLHQQRTTSSRTTSDTTSTQPNGNGNGNGNGNETLDRPPPLPNGIHINVGTMAPDEAGEAPDPEFRRRIEELAAREDFQTEEGQRELRSLVEDVVGGIREEEGSGQGVGTRRRVG